MFHLVCHGDGLLPVLTSLVAILCSYARMEILLHLVVARPHALHVVPPQDLCMQSCQLQSHILVDWKLINLWGARTDSELKHFFLSF